MTTQPEAPARSAIRIGTRGSPLALAQTEEVRRRLAAAHDELETGDIDVGTEETTIDVPTVDIEPAGDDGKTNQ